MNNDKTKKNDKVSDKKLNRLFLEQKIDEALSNLKPLIGKKKFEKAVKKASKLFSKDFSKKTLDSFRKQDESNHHETDTKDDTSMLIEELP